MAEHIIDHSRIDDVEIAGVNHDDYPDYSDVYVLRAGYDDPEQGYRQLREDELANLDGAWVREQVEF